MSDLTPKASLLTVDGVERKILFTFSVIDELQEKFDKPMDDIIEDYMKMSSDPNQLTELMKTTSQILEVFANDIGLGNESVEEGHFDRFITTRNIYEIIYILLTEYGLDLPNPSEDDDPNLESADQ